MKVTISVKGRFHAFALAQQMYRLHCLQTLITSYPKFIVNKYGIPSSKTRSLLCNGILERICQKFPIGRSLFSKLNPSFHQAYDFRASHYIPPNCDIFVAWSSCALQAFEKLKDTPTVKLVERGSSHILFQKEILATEHCLANSPPPKFNQHIIEKELKEYDAADYISVPSTFVKESMTKYGINEKKIISVPYGVDTNVFSPGEKSDKKFRIIFCGTLSLRKGIHYLLQAFYELNLRNSELWLIGPQKSEIAPFLEKYRSNNIILKGTYPESSLKKLYILGSVFCLPSIEEGMSLVLLQAMACELPIICTTNTGGEDIITNGQEGFIIPIRSIDAIKEKILFMYKHPKKCEEMGRAARKTVETQFTWDHYGDNILRKYSKILS